MRDIDVLYYSCPYDLSGYATVSRNHILGLAAKPDIRMRLKVRKFWSGVSPDLGDRADVLKGLESSPISNKDFIFIQHLTPENFFADPRAAKHIAYTPFETDGLPIPWLLPLRGVDEIWVPSKSNKTAYMNMGFKDDKIKVIPHGVDTSKYNPEVKPLQYNRGEFNFGSVFDWTERKNPTALIRAYYNAFFEGEDVSLTIRTFWRFPVEKSEEYIKGEIQKIKSEYPDGFKFPKILFWFDTMDERVMPNFYKSFDCFCLPTRGEGFGLPFLEAMACGVPAVGPAQGGNTEFMNKTNSLLVNGNMIPIDNHSFLQLQPQYSGQRWFDIDEVELSNSMRWVYDNKDTAAKIAQKAVKDIKENWTWKHTINKIHTRLREIDAELNSPTVKNDMEFMGVN